MTVIYLVRHGSHALVDKVLCGRTADVSLSSEGVAQARRLADGFAGACIGLVESSPRQRSRQTAEPIALAVGLDVQATEDVDELDVGAWSGRSFDSLAADPAWTTWNSRRGSARPPGGESMSELQSRVVAHIERLTLEHGADAVIVTHAEPIRAAILHYRGIPLDRFSEIEISPGSVSILRAERGRTSAVCTNIPVLP